MTARADDALPDDDLNLCALIGEEFTPHPFYGGRRMVVIVKRQRWTVDRIHVQRLMRMLGLVGMPPRPKYSACARRVYP